ncbi:MAG: copper resistance protein NlpE N-terminal domain-containing protein [Bacteroidia bacterium]
METRLILFLGICWLCSCSASSPTNSKEDELNESKQSTASALAKLPSKYVGIIGCSSCDSIAIEVDLKSGEQNYLLTKKYMGYGSDKRDSVSYDNGKWEIDGANELRLMNEVPDPEFSRFKIISEDHIMLLDSSGSEMTNGKNYTLYAIKDSVAVN